MSQGYGQFCAMARALETVGERWTLLVVRELLCGSTGFNQIRRGVPAISRDTLVKRLRHLCAAGLAEQRGDGRATHYVLTPAGEALGPVLIELASWTRTWDTRGLQPEHLDPDVLFWDLHRRIDHDQVPDGRTVVEFALTENRPHERLWLMIGHGTAEVCSTNGGFEPHVFIEATTKTLSLWWLGELDWATAVRSQAIRTRGNRDLALRFPSWFMGYALIPSDDAPAGID